MLSCLSLKAQIGAEPQGAHSWGIGNAVVAVPHAQSFFYNPAGLAFARQSFVAASFHAPLDLPRLSTSGINGTLSVPKAVIGIGIDRFGDRLYNESKLGIAIAKKIDRVAIGVKVSYLNASVENTNSNSTVLTEFGIIATPSKWIRIGFHAFNLTGAQLFLSQQIPTVLRAGFAFVPDDKITISAEAEVVPSVTTFYKAGLSYRIKPFLDLRTGINTGVRTNHFGVGYINEKWALDYAIHSHPSLGLSNHLSLQLNFGENEK